MSQNRLLVDDTTVESQDIRLSWWRRFYRALNGLFTGVLAIVESPDIPRESFSESRFWKNFFIRFFTFVFLPRRCAPLIVDYWLLIQTLWIGKQPGPDVVYPLLSIGKRQSGRLASLILQHSKYESSYELRSGMAPSQGIKPACVAVIDLDNVPRHAVQNKYSVQFDLQGLSCILILFQITLALVSQVFYVWD
ncbi:hypothetical protein V8E55_000022 [Tylopilus felleus]